ncbi:MAG: UDP-3-O-acyl-N-acetylglucosamine deacetylase [Pseudomonadota bacterium]
MDGSIQAEHGRRRTLKSAIGCTGIGLHTGQRVSVTLRPAAAGTGIVFRRTDLGGAMIAARFDQVVDTRLCTAIASDEAPDLRVGTIEHLMAAFAGAGIDDAEVDVDAAELPILDGSAAPFLFLIDCAGTVTTAAPRAAIEVLRPIRVEDASGAFAELLPARESGFEAELEIDFPNTAIGRQRLSMRVTSHGFRDVLADARTFTLAEDVARLRKAGLARGGSLANAVVVDGPLVLNPGGLRSADEFVRHKLLDVVGDLALAGAPLKARFRGNRSGHALNNRLLRALFADQTAWRRVGASEMTFDGVGARLPAAAAAARD